MSHLQTHLYGIMNNFLAAYNCKFFVKKIVGSAHNVPGSGESKTTKAIIVNDEFSIHILLKFYLSLANKRTHNAFAIICNKSAAAGSTPLFYAVGMNDELKAQVLTLPPGCFYYCYTRIFLKTTRYIHKNINKKI